MSRDESKGVELPPEQNAPAAEDDLTAAVEAAAAALDEDGKVRRPDEEAAQSDTERAALVKELEDWKSRAYRAAADLENSRKRYAREREEQKKFAIEDVLKDLLPVADNLKRAVDHSADDDGPLAQGVQMVLKQFLGTLERHGARPFDPQGEPFDPQFHEAMTQVPRGDVEPGTVVEVFQQGWMLHDRLVRPAMVIVSQAAAEPDAEA